MITQTEFSVADWLFDLLSSKQRTNPLTMNQQTTCQSPVSESHLHQNVADTLRLSSEYTVRDDSSINNSPTEKSQHNCGLSHEPLQYSSK